MDSDILLCEVFLKRTHQRLRAINMYIKQYGSGIEEVRELIITLIDETEENIAKALLNRNRTVRKLTKQGTEMKLIIPKGYREIVAARSPRDEFVTSDRKKIAFWILAEIPIDWIDRGRAEFMAKLDLGPEWVGLAKAPPLFVAKTRYNYERSRLVLLDAIPCYYMEEIV
jgi:hypothetical protein